MVKNANELQEEYGKEYLEFLIQKIKHAGGSLQFQHLSGLLQQLRFEIRDAFGVTKPALMKFLKAHASTFKVNSKGIVTVVSSFDCNDNPNEESSLSTNVKKAFLPKIKNGKGFIFKKFTDYAIIKAKYPLNGFIFCTPLACGGEKDSIFMDLSFDLGNEVYFNAKHGHNDYEIEYRATKVWRICDSDEENPNPHFSMNKITKTKKYTGEGVIKKLFPNIGFISVLGKSKDIFFYRNNVKDPSIKCKDRVEFVAECISDEWQATEIIKKKKQNRENQSSELSQTYSRSTDKHNAAEEKLKNEPGKIYPYSKGAVIKFGKNNSELADGSSCNFYLYETKVAISELAMEFSEGDDVKFDAIKLKDSPGWKAVLVWSGDKPANAESDWKKNVENRLNSEGITNEDEESISDISSEISDFIKSEIKTRKNSNEEIDTANRGQKLSNKSRAHDNPAARNLSRLSEEKAKSNNAASRAISQKLSHKDSKYNEHRGRNKSKNRRHKYNPEKTLPKRSENNNYEKNSKKLPIYQGTDLYLLESNETTSEENNELQDSPHFTRKYLVQNREYVMNASEVDENLTNETYSDNASDEEVSENRETVTKGKASIKKFEAIDGEITVLYCKVAFVKSNHLKKDADFILNAFYLNGKSVEEQQVIDLKEVIKVGDIIKFNCFEIVDDFGEIHHKITIAWKGPKPDGLFEIKPEEFILENELCVSINSEQDCETESESDESFDTARTNNIEESSEFNSDAESLVNNSLGTSSYQYSIKSKKNKDVDQTMSDVQPENLPDRILKKLKIYGITSSKPEVVLNAVQEIIELVMKNSDIQDSPNLSLNQDSRIERDSATVCPCCGRTNQPSFSVQKVVNATETEVQTVITGEIVSTSIFPEDY